MTSSYQDIYSIFLGLIKDYDFLNLDEDEAFEFLNEWLVANFSQPKLRKLFSDISWDNDLQQVDYTLRKSIDKNYDKAFFENMCANGIVVTWLEPKVRNNDLLINQFFGTKEANYSSQANHIGEVRELYNEAYMKVDKNYIRDHGYAKLAIGGAE